MDHDLDMILPNDFFSQLTDIDILFTAPSNLSFTHKVDHHKG